MPAVEVTRVVPAAPESVYALIADLESFPRYMESVDSVTVLRRDGNESESEWRVRLQGAPFHWVERDVYLPEEGRIVYEQTAGDLKVFQGEWRLEPADSGTSVTLTCEFEFGMPMIASLFNPVAKLMLRRNVESMLDGLAKELARG